MKYSEDIAGYSGKMSEAYKEVIPEELVKNAFEEGFAILRSFQQI
jgi:hypothetical protein